MQNKFEVFQKVIPFEILDFVDELEMPATKEDFETAIAKISSSVSAEDIKKYEDWMKEFGSA